VGILASANPLHGCYNPNKSFIENTKISNAILSRFDLIFLMLDKPDPLRDQKLSEHIMNLHSRNRKKPLNDHLMHLNVNAQHTSLN
jgi:DNA replicative helicase MCM subunit Mcm2 (Cdc46/Mcm family)